MRIHFQKCRHCNYRHCNSRHKRRDNFVAQAVNNQVTLLCNPFPVNERPVGVRNDNLAINEGINLLVHNLRQGITQSVLPRSLNKRLFDTLEGFATSDMVSSQSIDESITVLP